ncbi:DUF2946 family protein [Methylocystis sp. ATCC 49242]|uniref:DUF2946 family protein n=1 Tax=Methylocystis sp. ATCC 49242 TaxID=622637 RepID=UPI0035281648
MTRSWANRTLLKHALVACALACLLAIQVLSATGIHSSGSMTPDVGERSASIASTTAICDDTGDHNGHAGHQHDLSQCCVLCAALYDDASLIPLAVLAKIIAPSPPQIGAPRAYFLPRRVGLRQSGWESSWSSTAPPHA